MDLAEYAKTYELEESHWWFLGKRKIATEMICKYATLSPHDPILDVGCGTGGMITVLQQHGDVFGVDICDVGLRFASERGVDSLSQGSALALPFADDMFALITSFDLLYHQQVADDVQALREFYRICRPGGTLILTDSALPVLHSQHDEAYHATRRYTAGELRDRVIQAGFQVRKLSYSNTFLLPFVFLVRFWKRYMRSNHSPCSDLWAVPPALNSLLYSIYGLEVSLLSHIDLPVGSSLVCIARKAPAT